MAMTSERSSVAETYYASPAAVQSLERSYASAEVVAQRKRTRELLALEHGQSVLDIGCGAGHLCAEMASEVGKDGKVCGIDASAAMVVRSTERCQGLCCQFQFSEASALSLPFESCTFDAIVSVQVLEYIPSEYISKVFVELFRVLRPGGRVVLLDTDWRTRIVATDNIDRTQRALAALSASFGFADLHLPSKFPALVREASLEFLSMEIFPLLCAGSFEPGGYFDLTKDIPAEGSLEISREEFAEFVNEMRARSAQHTYFYSVNRFICVSCKPAQNPAAKIARLQ